MIEILGKNYYINVDNVIETCRAPRPPKKPKKSQLEKEVIEEEIETTLELNVFKFEIFKSCIERVLNEYPEKEDEGDLPIFAERGTSLSFKVAFNTLVKYNILIEDE
jgi:hypothetical protein